jgi:hypothetical protein
MTINQTDKQPSTETSDTPNVAQAMEKHPGNIFIGLRIKILTETVNTDVHGPAATEDLLTG